MRMDQNTTFSDIYREFKPGPLSNKGLRLQLGGQGPVARP
jgi:hypothetical protein